MDRVLHICVQCSQLELWMVQKPLGAHGPPTCTGKLECRHQDLTQHAIDRQECKPGRRCVQKAFKMSACF
eukprot:1158171-Pelagomonas_calceolata.AAC.2